MPVNTSISLIKHKKYSSVGNTATAERFIQNKLRILLDLRIAIKIPIYHIYVIELFS